MNKAYIDGFIKRAQEAGYNLAQAKNLLKQAGFDPSQGDSSQGMPPGGPGGDPSMGGGMPPQGGDPSQGMDPSQGAPDMGGSAGVPPELEQLIQNLPPEVLQQLVEEIQAELGNGGGDPSQGGGDPSMGDPSQGGGDPSMDPSQGGGLPPGMDPSQGMDPGMPKQGSQTILAKEAGYVAGFVERGLSYGFNQQDVKEMYKKALAIMEPSRPQLPTQAAPKLSDKQAAHFDGFLSQARQYGISYEETVDVYRRKFSK